MIKGAAKLLNMQKRQVYKWIWDEDVREKQRTPEESKILSKKNKKAFNTIFSEINNITSDSNLFLLTEIFIV